MLPIRISSTGSVLGRGTRGVNQTRAQRVSLQTATAIQPAGNLATLRRFAVFSACRETERPPSFVKSETLGRPLAPHLRIYAKQLTATLSIMSRITGAGLAAGFYLGAAAYAIVPFSSAALVSALHANVGVVYLWKAAIAFPFAFHSLNGIRHLFWDAGSLLTIKSVYKSGYITLALTALTGLGMVLYQ